MLRAFPNTQEYGNITIYIQPSLEQAKYMDSQEDNRRKEETSGDDSDDDDDFDGGGNNQENIPNNQALTNQPPGQEVNETILGYILKGDPYMQAVQVNEEANRRNTTHMQNGNEEVIQLFRLEQEAINPRQLQRDY
ncbi:hypothetical protein LIER_40700 [Lithospermum erythrorhizon]|uniref:Uncharacterized protein n=1 Tax=Lithospermum erythrorhizon TaxID=34254 RepID=A0AAV3R1J4_LITER